MATVTCYAAPIIFLRNLFPWNNLLCSAGITDLPLFLRYKNVPRFCQQLQTFVFSMFKITCPNSGLIIKNLIELIDPILIQLGGRRWRLWFCFCEDCDFVILNFVVIFDFDFECDCDFDYLFLQLRFLYDFYFTFRIELCIVFSYFKYELTKKWI